MWSHACLFQHEFSTPKNYFLEKASMGHVNEHCQMYAFHGSDNMFIAHTQVPQSHDLLFRFCHVAPQGSAVLAKGTTNRGTVEEINPVTQIDEGRVYLMEWIMD